MNLVKIATLEGVREYNEREPVELWLRADRVIVRAFNECRNNHTDVDLGDLISWLRSGQAPWWPIGTCPPLPEVPVLVWDGEFMTVAARSKRGEWYVFHSYGFNEDGQIYNPTHWMALPTPPSDRGA